MKKLSTRSWAVREALGSREPFKTYGNLSAVADGVWSTGRLPEPWAGRYTRAWRDNKITYTVLSYSTPIAWVLDDGEVIIPPVKYSVTTTGHQGLLYALKRPGDPAIADAAARERQTARNRVAERRERDYSHPFYRHQRDDDLPSRHPVVELRPVPEMSGEGAIYSPEYLHHRESAHGTDPNLWRHLHIPR